MDRGRPRRADGEAPPAITVSLLQGPPNQAGLSAAADQHQFVVADNGPGVLPIKLPNLFNGRSNKPLGSGFQLKFTVELLKRLGLGLSHQTNIPRGAKFLISIPGGSVRFNTANSKQGG